MKSEEMLISEIKVTGENFREDFSGVDELAEDMAKTGLIQPIVVDQDNYLVAGESRLRAAKKLGWKRINVVIKKYKSPKERIADSIRENMKRRSFAPAEELRAMAWWRENMQARGEVTTKKDVGRGRIKESAGRPNFAERLSKETGMSERTINTKARIGARMSDSVADALNRREITQKQAEQIVKKPKAEQDEIVPKVKGKTLAETKDAVIGFGISKGSIDITEEQFIADAKKLFNAAKTGFQNLSDTLRRICMHELVFTSFRDQGTLLMAETKFIEEYKNYKELQHGGWKRKDRGQGQASKNQRDASHVLADNRTIDIH